MSLVKDEQRQKIDRLENLYSNLKKEPLQRRTEERRDIYEQERSELWKTIEENHKLLIEAGAPKEYEEVFKKAAELNAKFYEKLRSWVSTRKEGDQTTTTSQSTTTTVTTSSVASTSTSTTTMLTDPLLALGEGYQRSSSDVSILQTGQNKNASASIPQPVQQIRSWNEEIEQQELKPSSNIASASIPQPVQQIRSWNEEIEQQELKPSSNIASASIPQPVQQIRSWNEEIEQQELKPSSNIEKILLMLAQNQLSSTSVKPPEKKIQPFDGNPKMYRSFKNSFARSIRNVKWSQIDLFDYLLSYLTGEPHTAISNLEVSDQSYTTAWKMLEQRYNNQRKQLEATMQLLSDDNFRTKSADVASFTTFMNTYQSVLANIRQMEVTLEDVIMELVLPRLDRDSKGRFEDFIGISNKTPTFVQLDNFLEKENIVWRNKPTAPILQKSKTHPSSSRSHVTTSPEDIKKECFLCKKNHTVIECDEFLASNDREALLKKNHICIFCVKHKYNKSTPCRMKKQLKCEICQGQHIKLMHRPDGQSNPTPVVPTQPATPGVNTVQEAQTFLTQDVSTRYSLLPTAIANVMDINGRLHQVRCLVDLCAERSYVCEDIVQKLRLKKCKTKVIISGINGITGKATEFVNLVIKLDNPSLENISTEALVVPKVTGMLPAVKVCPQMDDFNEQLADPFFNKPSFVGVLLGSDVAAQLFMKNIPNRITPSGLLMQPTHLGWIVSGSSSKSSQYVSTFVTLNECIFKATQDEEIAQRILDFYELPDMETSNTQTEVGFCEQTYQDKHYRLPDGRYVVPIPWKNDSPKLGHSYRKALRMFKGQESKWSKNAKHYTMSNKFMEEYEQLGHMTRICPDQEKSDSPDVYYIPYMSILRKGALTTKLRNVFNASMPSSNGVSLNDTMCEGQKLQTNIKDILLTARSFKIIYAADVSMMFRQILVRPEDRDRLRIIWRPTSGEAPREYRLNTITYGTDAAPFLAIRTIHQCAKDNAPSEEIENIIREGFYVDDLLYGADSVDDCKRQITEITSTLAAGKLPLTKWMSNNSEALSTVPRNAHITSFMNEDCSTMKLLGMTYSFKNDEFQLNYNQPQNVKSTKRGISSAAASFYDPMGFILPFIMLLRLFLQTVWKTKKDWDENIGESLTTQFQRCIKGVDLLNNIKIPRLIPFSANNMVKFIGFSDASSLAQAAVIYNRVKVDEGYKISLVTSKGNVAKLKTAAVVESRQCTIPKLELQALVTLAELYANLKECFKHRSLKFTAYTDSLVVLSWVRNYKQTSNKYVSKRVEKIRSVIRPEQLHYVKSEENPADPASRGLTAEQLASSDLWFQGPHWLQHDDLPTTPFSKETTALTTSSSPPDDIFTKYSKWEKILRIVSYCLRWQQSDKSSYLKCSDIRKAKIKVIKYYQVLYLPEVFTALRTGKPLSKRHWLYKLSPFLDKNDIIRVGGRLRNAKCIAENQRHPIVIPKSHCLNLLVDFTHRSYDHADNPLMLRLLTGEYWIPGVKRAIKTHIYKCVRCTKWNARVIQPEMGQLPAERVTPSITFEKVGVDLCGPFSIRASTLRFDRSTKSWIICFVCLVTKAVHLDIVSSLSSEHFLAAFSRFCSRRGTSSEVWSDNGTNFVGANRMLKDTWQKLLQKAEELTAMQEVTWKFIPRHSPTFGGLWEACVKSLKYFVRRMADVKTLTFEEFQTLLCKIEALLNSRPLCSNPLTPHEPPALTPFHFINQRGYTPTCIDGATRVPLTKKLLMIQQITHQFWQRFLSECLREMQAKAKWQRPQRNLAVNDIVIIKEPNTTPGEWKMGRVTKTYPDPQGTVRKVDVFTPSRDTTLHAVNRLVPLVTDADADEDSPSNSQPIATIAGNSPSTAGQQPPDRKQYNTRSKVKGISSVHLFLMVIMAVLPVVRPAAVEQLEPGVHLRFLGKVYQKAFDLEFTVTTNLNATADIETILTYANEFNKECAKLAEHHHHIIQQCATLNSSIQHLASQVTSELINSYSTKEKRWIQITTKSLWKAAPAVLTAAGMIYQESQIVKLQSQLSDTKHKMRMATNALLKVNDVEFEEIEGKLNEVIKEQQELQASETITDYAQTVSLIFTNIKAKHDDIKAIKPLQELKTYVQPLSEKMPHIEIPGIGEDIFTIHRNIRRRVNDLTVVTFTIPMVSTPPLDHWVILSVPTATGDLILLSNGNKVQRIVTQPSTGHYADATEVLLIHPKIIENAIITKMDLCTESIFNNSTTAQSSCTHEVISPPVQEEIVPVLEGKAAIFTNSRLATSLACDSGLFNLTLTAALFDAHNCNHNTVTMSIMQKTDERPHPLSYAKIEPLTESPEISQLKVDLSQQWDWSDPDAGSIISLILAAITTLFFFAMLIKCFIARSQTRQWLPDWEGPLRTI